MIKRIGEGKRGRGGEMERGRVGEARGGEGAESGGDSGGEGQRGHLSVLSGESRGLSRDTGRHRNSQSITK